MFPVLSEVAQGRSFCIQWVAPSHVSSRKRRACGVVTGSGMRVLTWSSISTTPTTSAGYKRQQHAHKLDGRRSSGLADCRNV